MMNNVTTLSNWPVGSFDAPAAYRRHPTGGRPSPYAPLRRAHHPSPREQYGTASIRASAYKIRFSMLSNFPRRTGQLCGGFCHPESLQNSENAMRALILWAGLVIAWTALGVLISSFLSPQIGTILLLAMFFSGLVVSWIATVFVMDGSLKNFTAEREQLEAERIGREYMNRTNPQGLRP